LLTTSEVAQRLADDLHAAAEGVDVRRVEGGDAALEREPDELAALLLGKAPAVGATVGVAVAHASERDRRDLQAAVADVVVPHAAMSSCFRFSYRSMILASSRRPQPR